MVFKENSETVPITVPGTSHTAPGKRRKSSRKWEERQGTCESLSGLLKLPRRSLKQSAGRARHFPTQASQHLAPLCGVEWENAFSSFHSTKKVYQAAKKAFSLKFYLRFFLVVFNAVNKPFGLAIALLSLPACIRAHTIFLVGTDECHMYSNRYLLTFTSTLP